MSRVLYSYKADSGFWWIWCLTWISCLIIINYIILYYIIFYGSLDEIKDEIIEGNAAFDGVWKVDEGKGVQEQLEAEDVKWEVTQNRREIKKTQGNDWIKGKDVSKQLRTNFSNILINWAIR